MKAESILSFSRSDHVLSSMLVLTGLVLVSGLVILAIQLRTEQKPILVTASGQPPEMSIASDHRWHLFISHVWASGQGETEGASNLLCE